MYIYIYIYDTNTVGRGTVAEACSAVDAVQDDWQVLQTRKVGP